MTYTHRVVIADRSESTMRRIREMLLPIAIVVDENHCEHLVDDWCYDVRYGHPMDGAVARMIASVIGHAVLECRVERVSK